MQMYILFVGVFLEAQCEVVYILAQSGLGCENVESTENTIAERARGPCTTRRECKPHVHADETTRIIAHTVCASA